MYPVSFPCGSLHDCLYIFVIGGGRGLLIKTIHPPEWKNKFDTTTVILTLHTGVILTGLFIIVLNTSPPWIMASNFLLPPEKLLIRRSVVNREQVCLGSTCKYYTQVVGFLKLIRCFNCICVSCYNNVI